VSYDSSQYIEYIHNTEQQNKSEHSVTLYWKLLQKSQRNASPPRYQLLRDTRRQLSEGIRVIEFQAAERQPSTRRVVEFGENQNGR
jgi:hypothetical protein